MKKFIISGLLALLLVPASVGAIGEVLTEDQSTTNNWCNANYPALSLTRANDGLICDALTARENMRKVVQLLQQLLALRQQLQVLLGNGNNPPPSDDDDDDDTPGQTNNKINVDLTGLKANYNIGDDLTFSLVAKQKSNGPTTLTFPTSCQTKFTIALNAGAKPIIYNSEAAASCDTADSSVTLSKTWPLSYTSELPAGNYKLSAEVIGYGKAADWYFNVKRPGDKSVSLTQPVGNVIWETGEANLIKWTTDPLNLTDKVDIILVNPSNVHTSLASATTNDGSESVTLAANTTPGTYTLFLRLTGTSINSQYAYITVQAEGDEDAPFITSISPTTGATSTEVTVKGMGFTSSNTLKFGTYTIGTNLASSDNGTEINFVVPATITTTGAMPIVVSNANGTSNSVTFALVNSWNVGNDDDDDEDPIETKIEVTSPSTNNDPWTLGTIRNITWQSSPETGAASTVNIRLINIETNQVSDIKLGAPNTETYSWKVGELAYGAVAPVGKYKFRVCPVGLGDCDRGSDNVKLISSTTTTDPNAKTSLNGSSGLAATASVLQSLINQLNNLLQSR